MNLIAGRNNKQQEITTVRAGEVIIGGPQFVVIAGPCDFESYEQLLSTAIEVIGVVG